jgi:AcrR family transcriptional regulator
MARPPGTPHRDYDRKRAELLGRLGVRLLAPGPAPSLRQLATAAGVTIPTLRHYFGTREDVVRAVFESWHADGAPELVRLSLPESPLALSVHRAVSHTLSGLMQSPLGRMLAVGLAEGFIEPGAGTAFLRHLLEPSLQALERRLEVHAERGELRGIEPRTGALILLSPLILAACHQEHLGGRGLRPLDLEALGDAVADGFLRAYGSGPAMPAAGRRRPVAPP